MARDVVAVIGGGPAGLAAAATLRGARVQVRVLEQAAQLGARWRGHYDRLHLHTTRKMSSLPGLEIPEEYGRWVSRDDFVRYQEQYARHHGIEVELDTRVERVDRAGGRYRVATSRGEIDARFVIVGGGWNKEPFIPAWPGRERFTGDFAHSRDYRNAARYRGKRVVVVGSGNSGAEIATELAAAGIEVAWSFRTPPTIVPRDVLGVATQIVGVALKSFPPRFVDPMIDAFGRVTVGDLGGFGLPRPTRGAYERAIADRVLPILDVGFVAAVRAGRIKPVAAVRALDAGAVELADGKRLGAEAIIAATGYRPALESLVGHLGALDSHGRPRVAGARAAPAGMYFLGYTTGVSGMLREIAVDARAIARAITAST